MCVSLAAYSETTEKMSHISFPVKYDAKGDVLVSSTDARALASPFSDFNLFDPGFQYLRADRVTPSVIYPKSQHAVGTRRFLGSRGEFTAHYLLEYGDDPIGSPILANPETQQAHKLLSQTNAWMQKFSPSVNLDVENIRHTDFVQLRYSYRTEGIGGGSGVYRATNVGFGLSYSLPIVVACLSAHPGDLLLIENPEAHLHPEGQLAMGDLMSRAAGAGIQVVVETHSDHVLNGIRLAVKDGVVQPEKVAFHFFRRNDQGAAEIQSPSVSQDGMLSDWPSGFFTQWDDVLIHLLS
jgi:predicted ATPase